MFGKLIPRWAGVGCAMGGWKEVSGLHSLQVVGGHVVCAAVLGGREGV